MNDLLFWVLATLLVLAALGTVLARSLYRAAYCLAGALVVTATFYLVLSAPLLAAVQILLYTGGVLSLVVFALVITAQPRDTERWRAPVPAAIVAGSVLVLLARHVLGDPTLTGGESPIGDLSDGRALGVSLFQDYLVPFELLSVLLLGAIFGALTIARREGRG